MERLRDAIAKARATREGRQGRAFSAEPAPALRSGPVPDAWAALAEVEPDDAVLAEQRIVAWSRTDPAHVAFDVLRTRILRLFREKGWKRILISSPTKGCGKTTVATNLAISMSRQADTRTVLVDFDLKTPRVATRLGLNAVPLSVTEWLASDAPVKDHFIRIGERLAVCLNTRGTRHSSEILQSTYTTARIDAAIAALDPTVAIFDMPPLLVSDDAIGFLPEIDCVLLVAAAGQTSADQIDACERLIEGNTNFLGVILNKCEIAPSEAYRYYDYDASEPQG